MATGGTLQELIAKNVPKDQARQLATFAERLFSRLPTNLNDRLSAQDRLEIARTAFEFFASRAETVKVRVGTRGGAVTFIESTMPDCAFIVDTVREYFHRLEVAPDLVLHPILSVARDREGRLTSMERATAGEKRESLIHLEIGGPTSEQQARIWASDLEGRLRQVVEVTADFEPMTARALKICEELAAARELIEIREFLRWLVQGGFVFLGYRRYDLSSEEGRRALALKEGSGLGILREERRSRFFRPQTVDSLDATLKKLLFEGSALLVSKTGSESPVHRLTRMDDVVVRRVGRDERVVGFDRFLGLFTSKAYAEESQHIPILRAKLKEVLEAEHALAGSHDFKELVALFNSFPKEELFHATTAELRAQLAAILEAGDDVRVTVRSDPNRRMVIVLVVMPRERFSSEVRLRIQEALARRLKGSLVYYYLAMSQGYTARLHFCFAAPEAGPEHLPALEREVSELARSWEDRLQSALVERHGEARGHALASRFKQAFSLEYKATTEVERAAADLERVEAILQGDPKRVEILPATGSEANCSELRLYELGEPLVLSELMPVLQNFGIRVLSEDAHELKFERDGQNQRAFVQAFSIQDSNCQPLDAASAALLAEALNAVRRGDAESDPLNGLTLSGHLSWREVSLVRAYLAAALQMKLGPARPALRRVFLGHPELARVLVDLLVARMDPGSEHSPADLEALKARYLEGLGAVDNLADDRIARVVLAMVEATVRTNYFQSAPAPDPYIALKFESGKIASLADVAPLYEIHVNSPRMEGCHLRAGKIARGGIRASDRPDDYRTEILELMKTQTVKNAIIVPVGAKGGFIVKAQAGQAITSEQVVSAYRTLINAMLDLTDDVAADRRVRPDRTKVLDDDGPYLVVAADKGTASFSDLANEIAEQRGFWLGDAFASGGRHGYDHKALGITARGAWESAKRHLREMERDLQSGAPVTVVGIGDMSGDVFGNGMLQSANLKLIAAFNHKHIFLDPDPDPAASFGERERLYKMPGSQWSDYNPALISRGGGVVARGQKVIRLSPEVRAALKTDATELDGESLIRAVLRAEVDLLYNGGIGTYVRAGDETDAQVGDHTNDECRITASELRAKVVVEGGNLGFTQKARIEYSLNGGRINTDAIDNSAGVDMSDHEVNLKILLEPARAGGRLSTEQRNGVLQEATEEVVGLVLRDNYDQALLLSLEQLRSRANVTTFRDHLTAIEQRGLLRRHEEALPTREVLRERRSRYPGLTRPELAVLMAYSKLDLARRLEGSGFIDQAYLSERFLRPYFPPSIAGRFPTELGGHKLRREIIATKLVNELVDLMGSIFIFSLARDYRVEAEAAVRAWVIAADLLEVPKRIENLRRLGAGISVSAEIEAFLALERAANRASLWVISDVDESAEIGATVAHYRPALRVLSTAFDEFLIGGERERFERTYRELRGAGLLEETAHDLARLCFADHLLHILSLSEKLGAPPEMAGRIYFQIAQGIDFAMVEAAIDGIAGDDRWDRQAARQLALDLRATRVRLAGRVLADSRDGDWAGALKRMGQARDRQWGEARHLLAELRSLPSISIAALQVAIRALAALV